MEAAPPPVPEEPPAPDWSLLPLDALVSVFVRLNFVRILTVAAFVCRSWRDAAKVPDVWRVLEMVDHKIVEKRDLDWLRGMARAAVDRSDGQLRVFAGKLFVTDKFLKYILERCFLSSFACRSRHLLLNYSMSFRDLRQQVFGVDSTHGSANQSILQHY
jgi:hypothetical protein